MRKIHILSLLLMPLVVSCGQESSKYIPQVIDPVIIDDGGGQGGGDDKPYEPWTPDIIDLDDPVIIDDIEVDDTVYDYSSVSFKTVAGSFTQEESSYTSVDNLSMAINTSDSSPFTHGTISADIKFAEPSDSGIVFGLTSNGKEAFWEGKGVSYYFFFISFEGVVYLGKSDNGNWQELKTGLTINVSEKIAADESINIKIMFYGNKLICFVDNELLLAFRDKDYLTGTEYGFRTGSSETVVSNINVSSDRIV